MNAVAAASLDKTISITDAGGCSLSLRIAPMLVQRARHAPVH